MNFALTVTTTHPANPTFPSLRLIVRITPTSPGREEVVMLAAVVARRIIAKHSPAFNHCIFDRGTAIVEADFLKTSATVKAATKRTKPLQAIEDALADSPSLHALRTEAL